MAIRMQKGRSRPFFVYWTNPFTGKRESKSCETETEAKKLDAYIKYQLQYERESFRREEQTKQERPTVQTLETVMYSYLKDRKLPKYSLQCLLSFTRPILEAFGSLPIEEVTTEVLKKMYGPMEAAGNKSTSIRRKMGIINAVLHWAQRAGIISALPLFPSLPKGTNARFIPPSPEEVELMYHAAPEHIQRVIVLGYYVGMRVGQSELLRLKWSDVDLSANIIRVPNANKGNSDPWREVPIQGNMADMFRAWQAKDEARGIETVISFRGKPVHNIKTAWKDMLRRAGITRHIRPYDLRHGFATQLIANGVDIGTVASLMGHKSPTMVLEHYQHVLNRQKKEAIATLPPLLQCVQTNVCKN